jgi:hypothetical protein
MTKDLPPELREAVEMPPPKWAKSIVTILRGDTDAAKQITAHVVNIYWLWWIDQLKPCNAIAQATIAKSIAKSLAAAPAAGPLIAGPSQTDTPKAAS